ncbi:MAG: hypothetical protein ABH828_03080 [archaeon]
MKDLKKLREKSLLFTRKKVQESISEDNFIIHTVNNIEELVKVSSVLTKRLRGWTALYLPEMSKKVSDNEGFIKLFLKNNRKELMKELQIKESMGKDLSEKDLTPMFALALRIESIYKLMEELKEYLETITKKYCKNMDAVGGSLLVGKLIKEAGSLKRLAMIPASTVQLLGAEKALFRHLKTGSRPPKHGIILQNSLVSGAKKLNRGKAARMFADKLSIAAKVDYFKGEFIGDKLRKELEEKLR